jgi:hypothetical protein
MARVFGAEMDEDFRRVRKLSLLRCSKNRQMGKDSASIFITINAEKH